MAGGFLFRTPNPIACSVYVPRDAPPAGTVLFLHGRGECGTNGTLQLTVGLPRWLMLQPERWPAVVVIPQKPDQSVPWHGYMDAVLAHLDAARAEHGVGAGRVVLTGLSQGGNGALRIGSMAPERFAAVAPVCGFPRFFNAEPETEDAQILERIARALRGTPMRLYHGEADDVIAADESRRVHGALRARGSDALLETYPGVGHNCWDRAYGESDLPEWLIASLRE